MIQSNGTAGPGFESTTAHGAIHVSAGSPSVPWFLALDHAGVVAELGLPATRMAGPPARYAFETLGELYAVMPRVYQLGVSLSDAPLKVFHSATSGLPVTTEAERLIVQRIGQDIFRERLLAYWQARCPLTGITDTALDASLDACGAA